VEGVWEGLAGACAGEVPQFRGRSALSRRAGDLFRGKEVKRWKLSRYVCWIHPKSNRKRNQDEDKLKNTKKEGVSPRARRIRKKKNQQELEGENPVRKTGTLTFVETVRRKRISQ